MDSLKPSTDPTMRDPIFSSIARFSLFLLNLIPRCSRRACNATRFNVASNSRQTLVYSRVASNYRDPDNKRLSGNARSEESRLR